MSDQENGNTEQEESTSRLREGTAGLLDAQVGKRAVRFKVPTDRPALVWDLYLNQQVNMLFTRAAAIGQYAFGAWKPEAAKRPYQSAITYGEGVANELLSTGWAVGDILVVGGELLDRAGSTLPNAKEDEEAGFFSG